MNSLQKLWDVFVRSLQVFGEKFMETVPSLLGVILVMLIAWAFARLVSSGFTRLLNTIKFDMFAERMKITEFLQKSGIQASPSAIIGRFIYWFFVLLIIASAAEPLGWTVVREQTQRIFDYLPNLVSAIVVFVVGAYLAAFVRDWVRGAMGSLGISTAKLLSMSLYYLLFIIVVLTALQQGKVETAIIAQNLLIIVGAIMFSAAISYGYASREVLANILAGFFNRRNFQKGMTIEIDGIRGTIVSMTNIAVTIQTTENEQVVIPSSQLMATKVKIIGEETRKN
jgi:small-conductance mechanosensitive channel